MPDQERPVTKAWLDVTEYNEMLDAAWYAVESGQMTEIEAQDTLYAFIRIKRESEQ